MDRRLEGKTALVTGASSGIGQSTAVRLGRERAAVGVNYLSDVDKGEPQVPDRITDSGSRAVAVQGDVFCVHGIRVNAVAPGAIATPINQKTLEDPEKRAEVENLTSWGRRESQRRWPPVWCFWPPTRPIT